MCVNLSADTSVFGKFSYFLLCKIVLIYVPKAYLELEIYVCQILLFSLSCKIMLIYVPKAYLELEVYAWRCPLDLMIFF